MPVAVGRQCTGKSLIEAPSIRAKGYLLPLQFFSALSKGVVDHEGWC